MLWIPQIQPNHLLPHYNSGSFPQLPLCDRIHAIQTNLTALGIRCEEEETAATIYPGSPHGGSVETYDDHRVAMAFSLVGLRTDGIVIENPACCRKTFENYFTVLSELTGKKTEA